MTLFLIDANTLITANNTYYPVDVVPEYWNWLAHMNELGNVKMPIECYDEVMAGNQKKDLLCAWAKEKHIQDHLVLNEEAEPDVVQHVIKNGYAADLTDVEIEQLGRDPFLISYALMGKDRVVVTTEISRPGRKRQNRKIPDVCKDLGVACIDPFAMYRLLGFSTSFKKK